MTEIWLYVLMFKFLCRKQRNREIEVENEWHDQNKAMFSVGAFYLCDDSQPCLYGV